MSRLYGIQEILKTEIQRQGLKLSFVRDKLGISRSAWEHFMGGRRGIPDYVLKGILFDFPQLNRRKILAAAKRSQSAQQQLPLAAGKEASGG